jgi:putative ATP-binding cassette transporter
MNLNSKNLKFDRSFFRDFYGLLKPYWTSEEKWSAFGLLTLNIICTIIGVRASVALNNFHKDFFDALQNFNKPALITALIHFAVIATTLLLSYGYAFYFNGILSMRWRQWLTKNYLKKWLDNHTHYRMQLSKSHVDNPDQRISEDLERFPDATLSLFFLILQSVLLLLSFSVILWELSGNLSIPIGSWHVVIPGYLFWSALLYAILGTLITSRIGKKLAPLDYQQQFYNADFRFSLIRLRESSEQIALYRGEAVENANFTHLFGRIFKNFMHTVSLKKYLTFFTNGYGTVANLLGVCLALPFYLQKKLQLGGLMQISGAFGSVITAFSLAVDGFSLLAEWKALVFRLNEFVLSIEKSSNTEHCKIIIQKENQNNIVVKKLKLSLPDGQVLLENIHLTLQAGGSFLLMGPSGLGKSTFLRTLAGLWPYGEGQITLPQHQKIFFLPQKPYLPLGTLEHALMYPSHEPIAMQTLYNTLELCCLTKLQPLLHETKDWTKALSLGEQQLIAFARILINKPDIIFLDEASSALDEKTEIQVYTNLRLFLPTATIISIGHRSSLHQFHEQKIAFSKNAITTQFLGIPSSAEAL